MSTTGGFWSCCNDMFGDFLKTKLKERMEAMISLQSSKKKLIKEMQQLRESRELKEKEGGAELNKDFRFGLNPELQGWFDRVKEIGEKVDKFDGEYLKILNGPDRVRGDEGSGASKEANGTSQASDHLGGCSCGLCEMIRPCCCRCCCGLCNMLKNWGGRLCLLVKLSGEVADMIGEVREVAEEGNRINKMVVEKGKAKKSCDADNMVGNGAQVALAKIRKHLEDDKVGIIAIYGTAGVGKSELLRQIELEYSRKAEYPVVISAEVTGTADLEKLQGNPGGKIVVDVERLRSNIAKDLPGSSTGWDADSLKEALSGGRFLLLLENLWEPTLKLEDVGIPRPNPQNKSKIVFTTRSRLTAFDNIRAEGVELSRLTEKEGRMLFRRELKGAIQFDRCKGDAKKIVKECHGLPLALKVMAQVMRSKNFDADWRDTVKDLQDPRTMFGEGAMEEKDVLTPLAYSYYHLREDWRPCFVYCTLFDSSLGIDRQELIDYWIGEGFFDRDDGYRGRGMIEDARKEGKKVINHLVSSCMLEHDSHGGETVRMHGLIRDMAIKMAADELLVYPDSMNPDERKGMNWEKVKRISLMRSMVSKLPTRNCSTLETLLLKNCTGLTEIPAEFFNTMSALRVLDLSNTGIQVLPEGIDKLQRLRHLNLSGTRITSLPAEVISKLNKLRQLNLSYTRGLRVIPFEAILGSHELRTLNLFQSKYKTWVWNASDPARGLCLFDLERLKYLEELSLNINDLRGFEDFLFSEVACLTVCLCLEGVSDLKGETDQFQVLEKLQELHITNILALDKLVFKSKWLQSLEKLVLSFLSVADISIGEQEKSLMPSLRSLEISKCKNLANLSWVRHLRDISTLSVSDCEKLKAVIGLVDHGRLGGKKQLRFKSNLKLIALKGLPNLENFSKHSVELPTGLSLAVDDCPNLTGAFIYYDGQGKETMLLYQDCQKQVVAGA